LLGGRVDVGNAVELPEGDRHGGQAAVNVTAQCPLRLFVQARGTALAHVREFLR
jgi:hypothetical protein